ncbi:MAG: YicC/YloC family endoribonuclease [Alphaproteobacteria bacterium]
MKSMTGYGEGAHAAPGAKISVQVKSLNHRHLDLQLRVPREYLSLEEEIRKAVRAGISRGRVEIFVNRFAEDDHARKLELDEALLGQYLLAIRRAKKKYQLSGEIGISLFSCLPDLFHIKQIEADVASERQALFIALDAALKKLRQSREREGRRLTHDMQAQIKQLKRIAATLEKRAAEIGTRLQKPLPQTREPDVSTRSEKNGGETGGWVLKGDINEEVVRLKSHVAALGQNILEAEPVGKKIDFILQEVQRELNTISSKVPQLAVVQLVLEGKERVEKIREQTQNIE